MSPNGQHGVFLKRRSEWSETVAEQIAEKDGLVLTDKHWDIINFVRTEYYANKGIVPLERSIKRAMEREWGIPVVESQLDRLFPGGLTQGARVAGCITIKTVKDLLEIKGNTVWSINAQASVYEALVLLSEKNIGALMVVENDALIGVLSERDITRNALKKNWAPETTTVGEIMSNDIVSVTPNQTLEQCMAVMIERGFRHLPVIDADRIAGVLSMPDLVNVVVEQQKFTISRLKD
jgi:TusE/DsrC/DsvC family sulfur relay protein